MFLSGDVHFAEVAQETCTNAEGNAVALVDFTSSGLSHAWAGPGNYPQPYAVALLAKYVYQLYASILHVLASDPRPVARYAGLNYGGKQTLHCLQHPNQHMPIRFIPSWRVKQSCHPGADVRAPEVTDEC